MVVSWFSGRGVGFGFGAGCGFGVGWGFGGSSLQTLGIGAVKQVLAISDDERKCVPGGGCGVGLGLGWGFGLAYGSRYVDSKPKFEGINFDGLKGKSGKDAPPDIPDKIQ